MKKLFTLIFCLSAIIFTASAQQRKVNPDEIRYYNNIELNAGLGTLTGFIGGLSFALHDIGLGKGKYDVSDDWHKIPTINLSYGAQLTPVINFGVTLSYGEIRSDLIVNQSGQKGGYTMAGCAAIVPTVRFDWLRVDFLRCYSRIGIGVGQFIDKTVHDSPADKDICEKTIIPHVDCAALGIAVGRKLYGYVELGVGTIGLCKAGVGYRF